MEAHCSDKHNSALDKESMPGCWLGADSLKEKFPKVNDNFMGLHKLNKK